MIRLNDIANEMEAAGEKITHRTLRAKARMGYARVKEYLDYRKAELTKANKARDQELKASMPIPKKERVELSDRVLRPRKNKQKKEKKE